MPDQARGDHSSRWIALAATLLFHGGIAAVLLLTWLYPSEVKWPPADAPADSVPQLLLGSEYVRVGDVDILSDDASHNVVASSLSEQSDRPGTDGADLNDAGYEGSAPSTISSKRPSPAKATVKPEPEKRGTTRPDKNEKERNRAAQEAAERVDKRTNFARSGSDASPAGNTGSPDGNSSSGASAGTPGFYLAGRTLASWTKPTGNAVGSIVVNVKVNRQGQVVSATIGKTSGPVGTSSAARSSCLAAARASRFSVVEDGPSEQRGTITYRFR